MRKIKGKKILGKNIIKKEGGGNINGVKDSKNGIS